MVEFLIAGAFALALAAMSLRAGRRFAGERLLPMQWGLDGRVNWSAPRALALAFMPVLGLLALGGMAAMMRFGPPPRAGQEGLEIPVLLSAGVILLGAHWFHLRLVARALRRRGRG